MQGKLNLDNQKLMQKRYEATMLLAAVGDAMGYKGGSWQFNRKGELIHQSMMQLTKDKGISGLKIKLNIFPYSDDTVMHIATAEGLLQLSPQSQTEIFCRTIAKQYKQCMKYMKGRAPGNTCIRSTNRLKVDGSNWKDIHFQKNAGGCGAAMRAACIGLYFYKESDTDKLIEISIQTGRTTHHNPIGYIGSFVSALFTAFAIRNIPPNQWLNLLLQQYLPKAKQYILKNRQSQQNLSEDWRTCERSWQRYAIERKMTKQSNEPCFPKVYDVKEREKTYFKLANNNWPGALGIDSVIIAYDALLSAMHQVVSDGKGNIWQQLCLRGMLHGGDNDSTGTIAGAWYGALYGFKQVFQCNYIQSQRKQYIQSLGKRIYDKIYDEKVIVQQ